MTTELVSIQGRIEVLAELQPGANGLSLRAAGQQFEVDLRRIDLARSTDVRTQATSAADAFQSSLSSIATSAQ